MNKIQICQDVQIRSNLPLQICLWLNVYVFFIWSLTYGFYILYTLTNLWNFEGLIVIVAYLSSNAFEYVRLYSGYSGNLKANPLHLNRFLILTPLILLPLLLFLLISAKKFYFLISLLIFTLFVLMLLEFVFGIATWQKLCAYQSQIYKLKREMVLQKQSKVND